MSKHYDSDDKYSQRLIQETFGEVHVEWFGNHSEDKWEIFLSNLTLVNACHIHLKGVLDKEVLFKENWTLYQEKI